CVGFALAPASLAWINMRSPSDALSARATAFFRCSKNSLAVGETFARLSSASAKFGSSARALSKCAIESVTRSFSARSRPARNSLRASSDEVVMAILPLVEGLSVDAVAWSTCWQPVKTSALISNVSTKDVRRCACRMVGGTPPHRQTYAELGENEMRLVVWKAELSTTCCFRQDNCDESSNLCNRCVARECRAKFHQSFKYFW